MSNHNLIGNPGWVDYNDMIDQLSASTTALSTTDAGGGRYDVEYALSDPGLTAIFRVKGTLDPTTGLTTGTTFSISFLQGGVEVMSIDANHNYSVTAGAFDLRSQWDAWRTDPCSFLIYLDAFPGQVVHGNPADDQLGFRGELHGRKGNDYLALEMVVGVGDPLPPEVTTPDLAYGGAGADVIYAAVDDARVFGGVGHDSIVAISGDIRIKGGIGQDRFLINNASLGGLQANEVYSGTRTDLRAVIRDFTPGEDTLEFTKSNTTTTESWQTALGAATLAELIVNAPTDPALTYIDQRGQDAVRFGHDGLTYRFVDLDNGSLRFKRTGTDPNGWDVREKVILRGLEPDELMLADLFFQV